MNVAQTFVPFSWIVLHSRPLGKCSRDVSISNLL